jgi:hypothetical protein
LRAPHHSACPDAARTGDHAPLIMSISNADNVAMHSRTAHDNANATMRNRFADGFAMLKPLKLKWSEFSSASEGRGQRR